MLKWFKKLTERFFGEEIEEDNLEEMIKDEKEEVQKQSDPKERPTFRFPIITDAEIYGWEDDEYIVEVKQSENKLNENQRSKDFNPVPLYENERWPKPKPQTDPYNRSSLFGERNEHLLTEEKRRPLTTLETNDQSNDEVPMVQSRGGTQRFKPSQVPSPIYGFKKPQLSNDSKFELETSKESQTSTSELHNESTKQEVQSEEQNADQNLSNQQTLVESQHEALASSEEEFTDDSNLLVESEDVSQASTLESDRQEYSTEAQLDNVTEDHIEYEETNVDKGKQSQEEVIYEERLLGEPAQQQEEAISNQVTASYTDETMAEPLEEKSTQEPEVKNDEKIVPFNVLMLKSDKRKLKARQLANEIANEMKSKEQTRSVEEPAPQEAPSNSLKEDNQVVEETEEEQPLAHYAFPELDDLVPPEDQIEDTEWLVSQSEKLEESLSHFGVQANVIDAVQGPTVTRFEFTVGQGTKVSRVRNLTDDLKLALAARDIRIEAPIPGKSSIGIEIPNRQARAVRISEVIQTADFQQSESPLEAVLGLGLTGEPVTLDLREMPHGMIAGATGSGKSVCINSILVSLLYKASPVDLKMMLIDPKMVELAPFNGIPHLISPVITDVKAATAALKWAVAEMERRYELLAHAGVRDIERYNQQAVENRQFSSKMPYLLIVIDELADLMMMAPADVEVSISRIAQKARACGIHLIIATQRPSVDVITGIIKANIPTRIAFSVSSQVDSRTMIDTNGAERLLGKGDMLYLGSGESMPIRLQGTFVTDDEIERIIEHVQHEASPTYLFGQEELLKSATEEEEDPLFTAVCEFIYQQNSASTSMLQRNFSIGYNRAAKLMDRLEELTFISPQQGSKARDVYITEADLNKLKEVII